MNKSRRTFLRAGVALPVVAIAPSVEGKPSDRLVELEARLDEIWIERDAACEVGVPDEVMDDIVGREIVVVDAIFETPAQSLADFRIKARAAACSGCGRRNQPVERLPECLNGDPSALINELMGFGPSVWGES